MQLIGKRIWQQTGSPRFEGRRFLVVVILGASLKLVPLLLLSGTCTICHVTKSTLVGAISQNLLATKVLLLHCPEALFVKELLLSHLGLTHLHLTLVHNVSLLLGVHALEMVGLDTMRSQH